MIVLIRSKELIETNGFSSKKKKNSFLEKNDDSHLGFPRNNFVFLHEMTFFARNFELIPINTKSVLHNIAHSF